MSFKIYLQDLNDEWLPRIREVLRQDLAYEIECAIDAGADPKTAEAEIIDDYLNRNNVGWTITL